MQRAQRVRYLIAASGGRVVAAYQVTPDGLTFVRDSNGRRRASFHVADIQDVDLRDRVLARAERVLARMPHAALNPVRYLPAGPDV